MRALVLVALLIGGVAAPVEAATYYLGPFTTCGGSSCNAPADSASCGAAPTPCATLAYWTQNRNSVLAPGDSLRITGTMGPVASTFHCIQPRPGVTIEGRNANDTAVAVGDWSKVVIDATQTLNGAPCIAQSVNCSTCNPSNTTIRGMTLRGNGTPGSGSCIWINPPSGATGSAPNFLMDNIRVTGCTTGAVYVGKIPANNDDLPCATREMTNLIIQDSSFDHNNAGYGLYLGCVDGWTLRRSVVACNGWDCVNTAISSCTGDGDGFHTEGAINGIVQNCVGYDNCEASFDFAGPAGGQCDNASHDNVIDSTEIYNTMTLTSGNIDRDSTSCSHCNANNRWSNIIAYGPQTSFTLYSCCHHAKVYNSTFWNTGPGYAFKLYNNARGSDFRNNAIRCNNGSLCVYVDQPTTAPETTWDSNVVNNAGAGLAMAQFVTNGNSSFCTPNCQNFCGTRNVVNPPDPQAPGLASGWDSTHTATFADSSGGLTAFRAAGDAAQMFGTESGDNDKWNAECTFVNSASPSAANLHLQSGDTVCKDAGADLSASFTKDYDGQTRARPDDVGADDAGGTGTTTSTTTSTSTSTTTTTLAVPGNYLQ